MRGDIYSFKMLVLVANFVYVISQMMRLLSFFHVQIDRGESMQKENKDKGESCLTFLCFQSLFHFFFSLKLF